MRSLFLVSLPRSLSTWVYRWCREALGLGEPVWTSDGEVLNLDRFALRAPGARAEGRKFTTPEGAPECFPSLLAHLDHTTRRLGFAYKDVVQPFVVSRWLPAQNFAILKIERPVVEVAYTMAERGWRYPESAAPADLDADGRLLVGLGRAADALATLPGERVSYEALVHDEAPLTAALRRLYPERPIAPIHYLNESFRRERDEILERRRSSRYQELERRWVELRETVAAGAL